MNGEASQAGTVWLDHQQATGFQGIGRDFQQCADSRLLCRLQFIAQTERYDAGCAGLRAKKEFGEIRIEERRKLEGTEGRCDEPDTLTPRRPSAF
ncbi:MAG: hypothetical protein ABMA01_14880 [Chthoniobacteraceae bacterium]